MGSKWAHERDAATQMLRPRRAVVRLQYVPALMFSTGYM